MGKIAFVFAGQGAQHPGMGKELAEISDAAAEVFKKADGIRPGTSVQCFKGTDEELKNTGNTQPCMYAVEMAAAAALSEKGIKADMTAGFSLGELAALTYSGAVDFESGFRLVVRRGALMQQASEEQDTAMAAVLRLAPEKVEEVCAGFEQVYPVNYNCPGQISVAGAAAEMKEFRNAVKEAGGRAIPLKVSGGFHSPFMEKAGAAFEEELAKCDFNAPSCALYSNCTGEEYGGDVCGTIARQMCSPVRWEKIIRNMIDAGADTFIELGPGNTLAGFITKINGDVRVFGLEGKEDLETLISEVK
ncbi:MAG: ACP S-malonyltransferase [Firmicutes bacterium]|nr:ACP S-malonyltransferase [Bacillota bacterium]